ncbi:hypothetical protein HK405_002758, partial [Cladochytrium tenue]
PLRPGSSLPQSRSGCSPPSRHSPGSRTASPSALMATPPSWRPPPSRRQHRRGRHRCHQETPRTMRSTPTHDCASAAGLPSSWPLGGLRSPRPPPR